MTEFSTSALIFSCYLHCELDAFSSHHTCCSCTAGSILSGHGMVQIEPRKWVGNNDINTVKFWNSHAGFNLDSKLRCVSWILVLSCVTILVGEILLQDFFFQSEHCSELLCLNTLEWVCDLVLLLLKFYKICVVVMGWSTDQNSNWPNFEILVAKKKWNTLVKIRGCFTAFVFRVVVAVELLYMPWLSLCWTLVW